MFEYEYPVFALIERFTTDPSQPANLSFHNPVTLSASNAPNALAVFTDRAAAEQFRDEQAPQYQVFEIESAQSFMVLLQAARQVAGAVAFDPFRVGMRTQTGSIDEVVRGLTGQ